MNFIKALSLSVISVAAFAVSSCVCCTGDAKEPSLRSLPRFKEVPAAPVVEEVPSAPAVEAAK